MSIDESHELYRAKAHIYAIVDEVDVLARGGMDEAAFAKAMLERILHAMEAVAGVVWLVNERGMVEAASHIALEAVGVGGSSEVQGQHLKLVQSLLGNPTGLVVPGGASITGPEGSTLATNESPYTVVAVPIDRGGSRAGLIEVFHHPQDPQTEQGYLSFIARMAIVAGDFLQRRQSALIDVQQTALAQAERFSRAVHESLDPIATAFTLANEARRIIGCDRVGVLVKRRRTLRLEAVSGQETVERRANEVRAIEELARVVARAGEPLWHPDPTRELPPQIEEELENYIDQSHTTALAIIPMERPRPTPVVKSGGVDAVAVAKAEAAPTAVPQVIAVLVIEWFNAAIVEPAQKARVDLVAAHGKVAISNALVHTSLPLYPLINLVGKSRVLTSGRNLPRTVLVVLALVAATLALIFVPAELRLEGKGTLEPVHNRDVFAGIDGVVEAIDPSVKHGAVVKAGQPLARLRNTEVDVAITDVLGRKAASEEQLRSTRQSLLEDQKISADERVRLEGRARQFEREIESLEQQRALWEARRADLTVKSPIDGVIVTWQVRDRLMLRPVEKGQVLMSVADKTGPWELEVHMPDDRLGHVNRAYAEAQAAGRDLNVDYILATDPGTRHRGTVREIHEQAEVRGDHGNTVLVRVTIDPNRHEKEALGAGASVTARIACGKRSLGYVWFHDVLAFIRTQVLFRLW
jgi:multidrug resistance efflux pump